MPVHIKVTYTTSEGLSSTSNVALGLDDTTIASQLNVSLSAIQSKETQYEWTVTSDLSRQDDDSDILNP